MPQSDHRPQRLALTAAAGLCVAVAGAILARRGLTSSSAADRAFRRGFTRRTPRPRPGSALARGLVVAATPGKKPFYIPATALAAVVVAARRGPAYALPLGATPVVAHLAHQLARQAVGRRRPLHALLVGKRSPSFPSGHAMRSSAVAFAVAWALVRENVAPGRFAVPIAVALPAFAGISRAYADVHWATDVVGGWGLGTAVGAGAALWYEWLRRDVAR